MSFKASDLHVISVISNPVRYESRIRLFKEFIHHMEASGVTLHVVEAVHRNRQPSIHYKNKINVRADDEIWLKENLINIGARQVPADAGYIGWVDADIHFYRHDWAIETLERLQNYPVVQPFSHVVDLGPNKEILQNHCSFAFCHNEGYTHGAWTYGKSPYWHPGYSFFYRAETWDALGGMIDRAVAGSGDHHMAMSLIGLEEKSLPGKIHANYKHMVRSWAARAHEHVRGDIGYVPGTILHHYHGQKKDRKYVERWQILLNHGFDPYTDLKADRHGVLRLNVPNDKRGRGLRDQLKKYFRERNEDPV
jgi:hypothetical protein